MFLNDEEGYWFSTEDGTHIFAKYGQSKADAIKEFNEYHSDYFYRGNKIIKYGNVTDMMDSKIFHYYFSRLKSGKKTFSQGEKEYFVSVLKSIYETIDSDHLDHYLIPDNADYLYDTLICINNASPRIQFNYKWPSNKGFSNSPSQVLLKKGFIFDRYGSPYGIFVSPVINGSSYSVKERALPYYIPENKKKDLYHKYEVIEDFSKIKSIIESYYDSNMTTAENSIAKSIFLTEYNSFSNAYENYMQRPGYANIGKIASAFDGGGGIQIELPLRISTLLQLKIIKEVK